MTSTVQLLDATLAVLEKELPRLVEMHALPKLLGIQDWEPPLAHVTDCPLVWINIPSLRPAAPAAVGGANATETRGRTLEIVCAVAGPEAAVVNRHLYSYLDLIHTVMRRNLTINGRGTDLQWRGTQFTRNLSRTNALYREGVTVYEITRYAAIGED